MKINEVILDYKISMSLFEKFDPSKKQEYIAQNMKAGVLKSAEKDSSLKIHKGQTDDETSLNIVKELSKADPSKGLDFINFIVRMYVKNEFRGEDIDKIKKELELFSTVKNRLQNKDINNYKSLNDLYDVLEEFQNVAPEDLKSKNEIERAIKSDSEKIVDTPNFKVIVPKTHKAACFYGANTKWCTASSTDSSAFDEYFSQGDLIIIIAKDPKTNKDKKFQLHFESDQFMNDRDQPLRTQDVNFLSTFHQYNELMDLLIKKHYYD